MSTTTPELLYHTTLTVVGDRDDSGARSRSFYVLGTHSNLQATKAFAAQALHSQGFEPDDFAVYEERKLEPLWSPDDGIVVYAKTPAGQEFLIGLATKTNDAGLCEQPDGSVALPEGETQLHYVVQSELRYHQKAASHLHAHEIEGCHANLGDALEAARKCLSDEKDSFAQYEERETLDDASEWPFGEDVVVHAISQTGENFSVAVKTIPEASRWYPRVQQVEA